MSNPPEDDKITNNTPEADDDNGALSFGLFWAQVLPAVLMLLALLA